MDAEGWNQRYAATEQFFSSDPNPLVADLLEGLEPGRALDLAAGEGRHALWLARRGWQVTAVDFSQVGLDRARSRVEAEGLTIATVLEDVYRYDPPPESFELVLIAYFHPRPADRPRVFERAARALVPGGHLLVTGRHLDDLGRDGGRGPSSNPERRYTPEQLEEELPEQLTLLRCEAAARTVPTDDGGDIALTDVIALARR
jgi:SAM-dependent methyltransferase